MEQTTFLCSCCDECHSGPPLAWHFEAPDAWFSLSPREQKKRGQLSSDQCIIDDEHFFIRGLVEIPVLDGEGPFAWGIWVSLSKASFERADELWRNPDRVNESPYFGWLCNSIPGYPETLYLKTNVHSRTVGMRPFIELEPTDHTLSLEQRTGIPAERVRRIAEQMYHHNAGAA